MSTPGSAPEPGETPLSIALQTSDSAAVAFALRQEPVTVPLVSNDDADLVRVFRAPGADTNALLLFSSHQTYVWMLPDETDHRSTDFTPEQLTDYLRTHLDELDVVWFDVAGPFPMQADPVDLLRALTL
ncbi:dehydrogenase [Marisediminicola senii]|uniref:dehydrogenase n=1 Tax=Marisediminicola senii TaxID=2711233 RepID=UPI0013EC72A7|nr:dehydrogenase [Marisediminicola senii]